MLTLARLVSRLPGGDDYPGSCVLFLAASLSVIMHSSLTYRSSPVSLSVLPGTAPCNHARRPALMAGGGTMLFDSWTGLGRVLLVGTLAYIALVLLLRISGKRTLSKLNAFDLVVTVALGSTLATVLLTKTVALAEGVLALGLLIFLQYAIAWLSVRSASFQAAIKAEPTLLLHRGRFLPAAMKTERISREEILAALRANGAPDAGQVAAVVLETDGSLSVIADANGAGDLSTLDTVRRVDDARA
jgi:uncharacterized membrane protein YcaP (DUF421 family)